MARGLGIFFLFPFVELVPHVRERGMGTFIFSKGPINWSAFLATPPVSISCGPTRQKLTQVTFDRFD